MKTLAHAMGVVYHHHERMDGSGYPDGLAGEAIPITARVTTVADVFDALTTARVYRGALSRQETLGIMAEENRRGGGTAGSWRSSAGSWTRCRGRRKDRAPAFGASGGLRLPSIRKGAVPPPILAPSPV